jgi:hypothetical protein
MELLIIEKIVSIKKDQRRFVFEKWRDKMSTEDQTYLMFTEYANGIFEALKSCVHINAIEADYDEDKVNVIYATTDMAWEKYFYRISNGSNAGPTVSCYLSAIDEIREQTMGGYATLNTIVNNSVRVIRAPLIYSLSFDLAFLGNNELELNILQEEVAKYFPFNRPYYFMIRGQYCCVYAESMQNESSVETSENKNKIYKRNSKLKIQRAYLDYPFREIRSFINNFNVRYTTSVNAEFADNELIVKEEAI